MTVATSSCTLETNAALACRLIRDGEVPREYFRWLANPQARVSLPIEPSESIVESLDAIFRPLRKDAHIKELRETELASCWLASICEFVSRSYCRKGNSLGMRLLATNFLPLYRTLATGNLGEGFGQMRARVTETLALVGMVYSVTEELNEYLESIALVRRSPFETLREEFGIDVSQVASLICASIESYDEEVDQFEHSTRRALQNYSIDESSIHVEPWAEPDLLWNLSGELISQNAEMLLPRSWIDTPVPWNKASDHWNALEHALLRLQVQTPEEVDITEELVAEVASHCDFPEDLALKDLDRSPSDKRDLNESVELSDAVFLPESCEIHLQEQEATATGEPSPTAEESKSKARSPEEIVAEVLGLESLMPLSRDRTQEVRAMNPEEVSRGLEDTSELENTLENDLIQSLETMSRIVDSTLEDKADDQSMDMDLPQKVSSLEGPAISEENQQQSTQAITREVDGVSSSVANLEAMTPRKREPLPQVVPKILIAEIMNHNDVAFLNVVRRQVAVCRSEERTICISMVVVRAEDQADEAMVAGIRENGLTLWQQKLVNWLADHPDIEQPYAFLTRDSQLILVALDIDRTEMTTVLRQGLVEVLTGKEDDSNGDLSRVNIPAKFHAGIASTASPGASFEVEDLIGSSHRCLEAAQRLGKASIKSIEVY